MLKRFLPAVALVLIACAPGASPNGNAGAACTENSDCVTPMTYLTRSVCPYTSLCIDSVCTVVCPMMDAQGEEQQTCSIDGDCDCRGYAAEDAERCRCMSGECVMTVN